MSPAIAPRDYSLVGRDARLAVERGLAAAQWYSSPISRKELKQLMQRRDGPAIRDTCLWMGAMIMSGALGVYFWGGFAAAPFFLLYGVLYGSGSDSRWHECGHGTAFRTRWMNDALYYLACFMIMREPTPWRWSHTRHHTDTIIVGRDPEIVAMRPPDLPAMALNIFALKNGYNFARHLLLHTSGRLDAEEATFVPETERWKVYCVAKLFLALYLSVIAICVWRHSILPAMLIGLPTFYGGFLSYYFGVTQHLGLSEDVLDHRLNSRTITMNWFFRFVYWNMNYHIEHHMFPMTPYHALPRLHEAIKADCPPAYSSTIAAYREIIPTLLRQLKDPSFFIRRQLPASAKPVPYNYDTQIIDAAIRQPEEAA